MSRPPQASFAQFFPAASRATRDRATERERASENARRQQAGSPAQSPLRAEAILRSSSSGGQTEDNTHGIRNQLDGYGLDATQPPTTDESDTTLGDTINTVGSASSHVSSNSSLFSSSNQSGNMAGAKLGTYPSTDVDSSAFASSLQQARTFAASHLPTDQPISGTSQPQLADSSTPSTSSKPRLPARDPACSVKAVKCIYDPLLDKNISSSDKRKALPKFQEFGMVCVYNLHGLWRGSVISVLRMPG
jgi:[histone H3]-lysine4 N-trimethyltransferase SETD1